MIVQSISNVREYYRRNG